MWWKDIKPIRSRSDALACPIVWRVAGTYFGGLGEGRGVRVCPKVAWPEGPVWAVESQLRRSQSPDFFFVISFSPPLSSSPMVSPDKLAVSSWNEWEVRKAGVGTKRKCPLCGKYKVKMKSELKDDEKPPAAPPPVEEKTGEKEENTGEPEEEEEKEGKEKKEHSGGRGFITSAALLLLAVGAGWFLVGLFRRRRAPPVDTAGVERINHRVPAFPGF